MDWLGDVPEHWGVVQVRRIGSVGQGSAFAHEIQGNETGEIAWFKVSDMNRDGNVTYMLSAANYVDRTLADELGATIFPQGTVVFPRVGAALLTNKRRMLSGPSVIDDNTYGIIPTGIGSRYLYRILLLIDMATMCSPGLVPTVTFGVIKDIYVPLPPAKEQEVIVDYIEQQLNKLDALTLAATRAIDLQLQEAIFGFERTSGVVATIKGDAGSKSGELAAALGGDKKVVVCTIQTFPFALKAVKELAATEGKRFAVIADEAHSSQTGEAASKLKMVLSAEEYEELKDGGEISSEDILAANMAA